MSIGMSELSFITNISGISSAVSFIAYVSYSTYLQKRKTDLNNISRIPDKGARKDAIIAYLDIGEESGLLIQEVDRRWEAYCIKKKNQWTLIRSIIILSFIIAVSSIIFIYIYMKYYYEDKKEVSFKRYNDSYLVGDLSQLMSKENKFWLDESRSTAVSKECDSEKRAMLMAEISRKDKEQLETMSKIFRFFLEASDDAQNGIIYVDSYCNKFYERFRNYYAGYYYMLSDIYSFDASLMRLPDARKFGKDKCKYIKFRDIAPQNCSSIK